MRPVDLSNSTSKTRTEKNLHLKFESLAPKIENPFFWNQWLFSYNWGLLQEVDSTACCCGGPNSHRVEQLSQSQVAVSPVRLFQFLVLWQSIKRRSGILFSFKQFFARSKMKYNLRTKEALTIENSPQTDICFETEVNPNPNSGLSQQMSNLTIENKFRLSHGSTLFIPDRAHKLYKIQVLEHQLEETKIRYIGWGPGYDSRFNSKTIWSYWCFEKPLSKLTRISKELSEQVDDLLIKAEIAPYVDDALAGLNSERIRKDGNLPDIKRLLHTKVPTTHYVPINVRYK